MLPPSISRILSFPYNHMVAAYVFFLIFLSLLFLSSICLHIICFRRQYQCNRRSVQLLFLLFIVCRMSPSSLTNKRSASETSGTTHQMTQHHIPKGWNPHYSHLRHEVGITQKWNIKKSAESLKNFTSALTSTALKHFAQVTTISRVTVRNCSKMSGTRPTRNQSRALSVNRHNQAPFL